MKTPVRGYAARRRWFGIRPAWVITGALALSYGTLWAFGVVDPIAPFRGGTAVSRRGMVAIPVSAVTIPSYTRIVRDHLWNGAAGEFAVLWLPQEQVGPGVIRDINQIVGRVMDHDKPAAYAFTEDDFLPKGTKPGIVAGIPAGKRAMRVPLDKIPGLAELRPGDRFDLVSAIPIDASNSAALSSGGLYGKQLDLQSRLTNWTKQATVRVIVQNGDIVQPTVTRQVPVANTSLTSGLTIRTKPVQEVVIAVNPGEVAKLAEALAVNAEISCVPRSGRPEDPRDSITPESLPVGPYGTSAAPAEQITPRTQGTVTGLTPSAPLGANPFGAGFTSIETISGTKREIVAAPVKR